MKRFSVYLVTALITFSTGVGMVSILTASRPVFPEVSEASAQSSITEPQPIVILDYDPKQFNPRGDYFIVGRKPAGFSEFDCLEIRADHDRAEGDILIQTFANQTYNSQYAVSGSVTNKRLTFVATPLSEDDFEYRFDGHFTREGILSDAGKRAVVLEGTLMKIQGCVKIAEADVKFRIEYLGC